MTRTRSRSRMSARRASSTARRCRWYGPRRHGATLLGALLALSTQRAGALVHGRLDDSQHVSIMFLLVLDHGLLHWRWATRAVACSSASALSLPPLLRGLKLSLVRYHRHNRT